MADTLKTHVFERDIRSKLEEIEGDEERMAFLRGEFDNMDFYDTMTLSYFGRIIIEEIRKRVKNFLESDDNQGVDKALNLLEEEAHRYSGRVASGNNMGNQLYIYAAEISLQQRRPERAAKNYELAGDTHNADMLRAKIAAAKEAKAAAHQTAASAPESNIEKAVKKGGIPTVSID